MKPVDQIYRFIWSQASKHAGAKRFLATYIDTIHTHARIRYSLYVYVRACVGCAPPCVHQPSKQRMHACMHARTHGINSFAEQATVHFSETGTIHVACLCIVVVGTGMAGRACVMTGRLHVRGACDERVEHTGRVLCLHARADVERACHACLVVQSHPSP
jgi:hypothetical protein